MNNLWEMIAKARNVELGEEFIWRVVGRVERCKVCEDGFYVFEEDKYTQNHYSLGSFLMGEGEITKLPFEPKLNETYWSYNSCIRADDWIWLDSSFDYRNKMLGLVFRTKEEAENYLPTFKEKLKEVGWLEK